MIFDQSGDLVTPGPVALLAVDEQPLDALVYEIADRVRATFRHVSPVAKS